VEVRTGSKEALWEGVETDIVSFPPAVSQLAFSETKATSSQTTGKHNRAKQARAKVKPFQTIRIEKGVRAFP